MKTPEKKTSPKAAKPGKAAAPVKAPAPTKADPKAKAAAPTKADPKAKAPAPAKAPAAPKEPRESTGTGGVVDRERYTYEKNTDTKTPSGRASVDNGDELAAALRGKSSEQVVALVASNGGTVNPAWADKNPGLQRMAAGNVLRGLARTSEKGVVIDGKTYKITA